MKKYFAFDRGILDPQGMENVTLRVTPVIKDVEHESMLTEGVWETPPRPWEVRFDNGYPNVIYDGKAGLYRCYYTTFSTDRDSYETPLEVRKTRDYRPENSRITSLAYAESLDGLHWTKPNLGRVDLGDGGANNLVFHYAHGTGVILDQEETDPRKRYKLVTKIEYPGNYSFMAVSFSSDGLDWCEPLRWPKYNPAADSHNFVFRDQRDGKYKLITRTWQNGLRLSSLCESDDFRSWSEPREILRGNGFQEQIYSMPVWQYQGLYLGLASIFHEGDRQAPDFDCVDCELAYATEPLHFDRVAPGQSLIPRGAGRYPDGAFDCGCIYTAAPVEQDGKLWFYYMGSNGQHTNFRETRLARAWLPVDRFAAYRQTDPSRTSVLPFSRFRIHGERLCLLAELEPGGGIEAALCPDRRSEPYEGFGYGDCILSPGPEGWLSLTFSKPFAALETRQACIMIRFRGAAVFALGGDIQTESIRY